MADDRRQQVGHPGFEDLLGVVRVEPFCHHPRIRQLVEGGGCPAEADGEGGDALIRHLAHAGHDGAGINASAQEDAQGDVALEPKAYSLPQRVADPLGRLAWRRRVLPGRPAGRQIPVSAKCKPAAL